jgi:Ca2+/Na+ antiporter
MGSKKQTAKTVEKINALNQIFEDVISDASDLITDLYWSVKMYLFFGLITLLFGVQTLVYNIDVIQERLYIPLFVAGAMIFAGAVQILNFFRLRKKYSRLFRAQNEMKST